MTDKDANNQHSQSFFKTSFLSSINAFSNHTKQLLPDVNKRLIDLQKRARELPNQIIDLQYSFESERMQFVKDKKLDETNGVVHHSKGSEIVAPWMGYRKYENKIKQAILDLSKDERNFLIPPPEDTDFQFNFNAYSQSAQAVLKEDERLARLRFILVPQQVSEPIFWRNYFYRVTLVKQSVLNNIESADNNEKEEEEEEEEDFTVKKDKVVLFNFNENEDDSTLTTSKKPVDSLKNKVEANEYEGMEEWEIELRRAAIE
ncbi:uncharacterized protein BX663DRAFT_552470 [Cokeromyces recurvatus]|uniref:uncharacterized protein n=1 Tax=Cokeromyces recurvatus TaxID=90255 RepID=UPI00221ECBE2|nr:uncharacterized protein BX663DRAFT_552470 [Cokeromyces recurvatus]KAI7902029.1 hypothetical protein BX663DRAFT_552470 [Cokeromyces recurvatus]